MTLEKLSKRYASVTSISLALIFMLKIYYVFIDDELIILTAVNRAWKK